MSRSKPRIYETSAQFSALGRDWYATVRFSVSGRYYPATLTQPAEYATRDVEEVLLSGVAPVGKERPCNEVFREPFAIDYTELPHAAQDAIQDAANCADIDPDGDAWAEREEARCAALGVDP